MAASQAGNFEARPVASMMRSAETSSPSLVRTPVTCGIPFRAEGQSADSRRRPREARHLEYGGVRREEAKPRVEASEHCEQNGVFHHATFLASSLPFRAD